MMTMDHFCLATIFLVIRVNTFNNPVNTPMFFESRTSKLALQLDLPHGTWRNRRVSHAA